MTASKKTAKTLFTVVVAMAAMTSLASASSFKSLVADGYKAGPLSRNQAGNWGWKMTKGKDVTFCKMNVSTYYVGKNGMGSFTTAGRMINIDKKSYMNYLGITHDDSIPRLEDLKAGRPRPEDTGPCVPFR